jgi:hypothetical protein
VQRKTDTGSDREDRENHKWLIANIVFFSSVFFLTYLYVFLAAVFESYAQVAK